MPVEGTGYQGHLVTRHADVLAMLLDDATFSNRATAKGIGLVLGRTITEMDGAEHARHRALIMPSLLPRALKGEFLERVRAIADERIDNFVARGAGDLVEEFTFTYPLRVFTHILGIPADEVDTVHRWAIDLTRVGADPLKGFQASQALADYFAPILAERRREPRADMISQLVQAEVEGQRLSDEEVTSFLRLLVIGGAETTYHLLGSALYALLTHPEAMKAVLADPGRIGAVIDETLRWEGPIGILFRETTRPVRIGDVSLPEGERVLVALGSANRDEHVYPDPDEWRLDRDRETNPHLAFGQGRHYCAGSRLALVEARIGLEAILGRLPKLVLSPTQRGGVVGLAFRGPAHLDVTWDPRGGA